MTGLYGVLGNFPVMGVLWREELTPVSGDHRGLMKALTRNNTAGHSGTATPKRLG